MLPLWHKSGSYQNGIDIIYTVVSVRKRSIELNYQIENMRTGFWARLLDGVSHHKF